jgi:hypothetical protein
MFNVHVTNCLTPYSRILFDKLTVVQLVKKFRNFMEPEGSPSRPEELVTGSKLKAVSFRPLPYIHFILNQFKCYGLTFSSGSVPQIC